MSMTTNLNMLAPSGPHPRFQGLTDKQEYRLLFAVTFIIFFIATVVMRLLPVFGGNHGSAAHPLAGQAATGRSLFAEAKAAGYSALAFAFMG